MGYSFDVFQDHDHSITRLLGSGDVKKLAAVKEKAPFRRYCRDPLFAAAIEQLIMKGPDGRMSDADIVIEAFLEICRVLGRRVGDLDHFRYEEEDFPELTTFKCGRPGSFEFPGTDDGIPSAGCWSPESLQTFSRELKQGDVSDRPRYVKEPFKQLIDWTSAAADRGEALFVFYGAGTFKPEIPPKPRKRKGFKDDQTLHFVARMTEADRKSAEIMLAQRLAEPAETDENLLRAFASDLSPLVIVWTAMRMASKGRRLFAVRSNVFKAAWNVLLALYPDNHSAEEALLDLFSLLGDELEETLGAKDVKSNTHDDPLPFGVGLGSDRLIGYRRKTGEVVIAPKYASGFFFERGRASVMKNGLYGYIDLTGTEVIPLVFESADDFEVARPEVHHSLFKLDRYGRLYLNPTGG